MNQLQVLARNSVIITILIKIFLLYVFSSSYSSELFLPFTNVFTHGNFNPWQYYYEHALNLDSFPYHGLMLYILSPFTLLINFFHIENPLSVNFIFKIPLLITDIVLFITLMKFFPLKEKQIFYFYFLNPIILYAIYMHSQLDIIPMAFLMIGIYFLTLERLKLSAVFIGFALATKLHILIALPLLLFYLFKKHSFKEAIIYLFITFGTLLFLDLPFIFSDGFLQMVLMNPKQSLLFDSYYKIGKLELLLPISSILMVYFHFFNQKKVNQDLLFFYFGLLFTATIFFIYPAPAWYVWLVPFVSIYFIQNDNDQKNILLYLSFSVVYLVFFVFFHQSEYNDILFLGHEVNFKIENNKLINMVFTLLESMLLAIMYAFYRYGIKSNAIYKKQTNLTIGIGGDSGVGKSSLLSNITLLLGNKLLPIEGDGEHKWERGDENWSKFTHLDPKANHIHKQANAIYELKHNHSIFRSEYDHDTGKFRSPLTIDPKEFIVISGLHPFYLPKLRKIIDLKVYLDTDENLRRHWKIIRDTQKRGYSKERSIQQIEERIEDTLKYIYPQKAFADLVISYFPIQTLEVGNVDQVINLGLKITIDASIRLEELLDHMDCEYIWDYNDDLHTQYIELHHEPSIDFESIALNLIPNVYEIVSVEALWKNGYNGFIQLIILMMISEKLKEDVQ